MSFWEVILDDEKEILGRYNQEFFTEQKIGEIIKKLSGCFQFFATHTQATQLVHRYLSKMYILFNAS